MHIPQNLIYLISTIADHLRYFCTLQIAVYILLNGLDWILELMAFESA